MPGLGDHLSSLELPSDLLGRDTTEADKVVATGILALHDDAVTKRRRRFATGLAVAFLAFTEELARQLPADASLAEALTHYPPQDILPSGAPANTLTVNGPQRLIGLRRYYNAAEHVIIRELARDYPNMAPHATQAWPQERAILDALLQATPGARRLFAEGLWGRIEALYEFTEPGSGQRSIRPFEVVLRELPNTQRGEPPGSVLQALAFAYFSADAPNVILETGKVGAGSSRSGRVGDIDGWSGNRLVLSVEVKDMDLAAGNLPVLDGFLRNLARAPDATAIVHARSFDEQIEVLLSEKNILTLSRDDMATNVSLWDVAKQRVAVDAMRYFIGKVQRSGKLLVRFEKFLRDAGVEPGESGTASTAPESRPT